MKAITVIVNERGNVLHRQAVDIGDQYVRVQVVGVNRHNTRDTLADIDLGDEIDMADFADFEAAHEASNDRVERLEKYRGHAGCDCATLEDMDDIEDVLRARGVSLRRMPPWFPN
jgi:hypothetical protein